MNEPITFGKYCLLERINVGGMAEVFRAKAFGVEGFERLVAVKRILPNIAEDKDFIRMFIDEAKLAVQLNHANIAQIFDLGMVDSAYYIALEHIHGRDLRAIFDRCRQKTEPMPVAQACFVSMKVCEGLDYAHNKRNQSGHELNLVHRDVSPQNVLVSFEGEVKIIDFGIAKAAGKGSKTQAGILKGKFGYMSPEQVRGLPVDRRSDIFSCGIVLYELLTGERLFIGESDFSTLEKVRNVEILPPSTYNRNIPDELERIVLKALAKDVSDRYQNAIDLHDELQAFVYTAGEFYSRKDLAGWMKSTFSKEIERESAKLEGFRQLKADDPIGIKIPRSEPIVPSLGPRRSTLSMAAVGTKPPPIPAQSEKRRSGAMPAVMAASASAPGPVSAASTVRGMGAASQRPSARLSTQPPPLPRVEAAGRIDVDLDWDEDELETAIYDDGTHETEAPLRNRALGPASYKSKSKPMAAPPVVLADGSNRSPSPADVVALSASSGTEKVVYANLPKLPVERRRLVPTEGIESFGSGLIAARPPRRLGMVAAIAALGLLLVGGGIVLYALLKNDNKTASVAAAASPPGTAGTAAPGTAAPGTAAPGTAAPGTVVTNVTDPNTGFDLYVVPSNVKVKLDGDLLSTNPPLSIRQLSPGDHEVEIMAPAGYASKTQTIRVEAGKAPKITISLDGVEVMGRFDSRPSGARIYLTEDGVRRLLGKAPQTVSLNPQKKYDVTFKRDGHVTMTHSIVFNDNDDIEITARLDPSGRERQGSSHSSRLRDTAVGRSGSDTDKLLRVTPNRDVSDAKDSSTSQPPAAQFGMLALGSKPPCRIFIDGRDTGLRTPKKGIKLKSGKHRVTLINNEHGIKESFSVTISGGKTTRRIKDWSDRIKE